MANKQVYSSTLDIESLMINLTNLAKLYQHRAARELTSRIGVYLRSTLDGLSLRQSVFNEEIDPHVEFEKLCGTLDARYQQSIDRKQPDLYVDYSVFIKIKPLDGVIHLVVDTVQVELLQQTLQDEKHLTFVDSPELLAKLSGSPGFDFTFYDAKPNWKEIVEQLSQSMSHDERSVLALRLISLDRINKMEDAIVGDILKDSFVTILDVMHKSIGAGNFDAGFRGLVSQIECHLESLPL